MGAGRDSAKAATVLARAGHGISSSNRSIGTVGGDGRGGRRRSDCGRRRDNGIGTVCGSDRVRVRAVGVAVVQR